MTQKWLSGSRQKWLKSCSKVTLSTVFVTFESLLSNFWVTFAGTPKVTFESLLLVFEFFGVWGSVGLLPGHKVNTFSLIFSGCGGVEVSVLFVFGGLDVLGWLSPQHGVLLLLFQGHCGDGSRLEVRAFSRQQQNSRNWRTGYGLPSFFRSAFAPYRGQDPQNREKRVPESKKPHFPPPQKSLASRKGCDLKTRKRCDFFSAAQKIANDFSAISSAIFWRSFCDFCGKTCDLVLCDLKTQRFFCDCEFLGR